MGVLKKYRRYNHKLKLAAAQGKNPYRFPELKIPRTTALYWIKKAEALESISPAKIESERIHLLEFKVEQKNALLKLIKKVRCIFPHSFQTRKFIYKAQRKILLKLFNKPSTGISLKIA